MTAHVIGHYMQASRLEETAMLNDEYCHKTQDEVRPTERDNYETAEIDCLIMKTKE